MTRIVKNPEERRDQLIAIAQQLFFTKGYESTSVNDIIEAVGVSKGTFYYYFESKLAILETMAKKMVDQAMLVMEEIVRDDSLDAIAKWTKVFQVLGNWKLNRREELVAYAAIFYNDDNIRLLHKLQIESNRAVPVSLAKIIEQGNREGLFHTDFIQESAEIAYMVMQTYSDSFTRILLHPEWFDSPAKILRNKVRAMETAVARILGAPPGSIQLMDDQAITAWFGDK